MLKWVTDLPFVAILSKVVYNQATQLNIAWPSCHVGKCNKYQWKLGCQQAHYMVHYIFMLLSVLLSKSTVWWTKQLEHILRNVDKYRIFVVSAWNDEAVTFLTTEWFDDTVSSWSGTSSLWPTTASNSKTYPHTAILRY